MYSSSHRSDAPYSSGAMRSGSARLMISVDSPRQCALEASAAISRESSAPHMLAGRPVCTAIETWFESMSMTSIGVRDDLYTAAARTMFCRSSSCARAWRSARTKQSSTLSIRARFRSFIVVGLPQRYLTLARVAQRCESSPLMSSPGSLFPISTTSGARSPCETSRSDLRNDSRTEIGPLVTPPPMTSTCLRFGFFGVKRPLPDAASLMIVMILPVSMEKKSTPPRITTMTKSRPRTVTGV
mmetsp:Transcript_24928/g.59410  ORF Transcript_24928/g.59410 Transcript_24928/m.59410 type:complete len:242 (+) Transcript_24928:2820-3545(+)